MSNEENPQEGGSYIRNADGTLTKADAASVMPDTPATKETQPAALAASTAKGAE